MITRGLLRLAALAALAAAGCGAPEGTVRLSITTAPDSDVMESVERVVLTLSDPPAVTEAERGPDGAFELALDVVADGERGRITFEGFDATGDLVAVGYAGPLPIAAITVGVELYVAAPESFAAAPVALEPARTEIGAAPLVYGAMLAGGRDEAGEVLDDALIYNVHGHAFQIGEPLPEPRAAPALAARPPAGPVYIFGGRNDAGDATQSGWSFDAQAPPAGIYAPLDVGAGLAREGARAAPLGDEAILVTGDPPVEIDAATASARPFGGAPALAGTATATAHGDDPLVFVTGDDPDEPRAARWGRDGLVVLDAPGALARRGHGAAALRGGDVLVVGGVGGDGPLSSAVRYRIADDAFEVIDEFLTTPREGAAIAATRDRLVVIGGTDGAGDVLADAEIFDAETLEPLEVAPLVAPRAQAAAIALENGQILVAGGVGDDGDPVAVLELYTPSP